METGRFQIFLVFQPHTKGMIGWDDSFWGIGSITTTNQERFFKSRYCEKHCEAHVKSGRCRPLKGWSEKKWHDLSEVPLLRSHSRIEQIMGALSLVSLNFKQSESNQPPILMSRDHKRSPWWFVHLKSSAKGCTCPGSMAAVCQGATKPLGSGDLHNMNLLIQPWWKLWTLGQESVLCCFMSPKRIQRWSGSVDIWDAISVNACHTYQFSQELSISLVQILGNEVIFLAWVEVPALIGAWFFCAEWVQWFVQRASQNFAELSNYEKPQRTKMRSRAKPFSK
jgi:hypothetical protein